MFIFSKVLFTFTSLLFKDTLLLMTQAVQNRNNLSPNSKSIYTEKWSYNKNTCSCLFSKFNVKNII